jgi:alpha-tubulin suppressor-like RCC1 family protein
LTGKTYDPVKIPTRLAENEFKRNSKIRIVKIASGAHHTLMLTSDGKVQGWGDPESG